MEHTLIPTEELEVFKKLKDIEIVFDVGARADVDYLVLKPNIELHAFEPVPLFFSQLVEGRSKLPLTRLTYLNNYGLGDVEGEFLYNASIQAFEFSEAHPDAGGDIKLPVKTLDWYCDNMNIKHIDFLKIDVEGYDYKVLLGGKKIVPHCKYIQYEYWDEKQEYHDLLEKQFHMEYIGYRNVLCINKKLVPKKDYKELVKFIRDSNYASLWYMM